MGQNVARFNAGRWQRFNTKRTADSPNTFIGCRVCHVLGMSKITGTQTWWRGLSWMNQHIDILPSGAHFVVVQGLEWAAAAYIFVSLNIANVTWNPA